jgi:predicted aldo/keto reductase-like oxidoreductase
MAHGTYTWIDNDALKKHVRRVCKKNIKAKCKCCQECPFKDAVESMLAALAVEEKFEKHK